MDGITINATDLGFSLDRCPRCFYLSAVHGIEAPSGPIAGIFSIMSSKSTEFLKDKNLSDFGKDFPKGKIFASNKRVQSQPLYFSSLDYEFNVSGQFDHILKLEDGSYAVILMKNTQIHNNTEAYTRQLHTYALALEYPSDPEKFNLRGEITRLGIVVAAPFETFVVDKKGESASYTSPFYWQEIPYNLTNFKAYLREIAEMFQAPKPPEAAEDCPYCKRDKKVMEYYYNIIKGMPNYRADSKKRVVIK